MCFDRNCKGWVGKKVATCRSMIAWAAGDLDRLRRDATELVSGKPEVIFGYGTPVVAALQRATQTIPIVFANANDPVGSGFVKSIARPGGNITGFVSFERAIGGKWLEMLKEISPGVLYASA